MALWRYFPLLAVAIAGCASAQKISPTADVTFCLVLDSPAAGAVEMPIMGADEKVLLNPHAPVVSTSQIAGVRVVTPARGYPAIQFLLTREGAEAFGGFTARHIGRRVAVVSGGQVIGAPVIRAQVFETVEITGSFTKQQAKDLVAAMTRP